MGEACRPIPLPFRGESIKMGAMDESDGERMEFRTRKIVTPRDLNPHGTLFGGRVLQWIDEEAFIYASCQIDTTSLVTKLMSAVDFVSSARLGDIVEIGCEVLGIGTTSITVTCQVRNKETGTPITEVERIVFVNVDENGRPAPHGVKGAKAGSITG